jgi:hypothetical protein
MEEVGTNDRADVLTLSTLPDNPLHHIFSFFQQDPSCSAGDCLVRLCRVNRSLHRLLSSAELAPLWDSITPTEFRNATSLTAKDRFVRYAASRCHDCKQPTNYQFVLLRRRLCERCERASPQVYGLKTKEQLVYEQSIIAQLSSRQQQLIFAPGALPSMRLAGHDWYCRQQAIEAARELMERCRTETPPAASLSAAGDAEVRAVDLSEDSDEPNMAFAASDDTAALWEHAAAAHTARRRPGTAERALQRDAQKAHKRKVKAEQRARRECSQVASRLGSQNGTRSAGRVGGASSSHKPKRTSARVHRTAARPDAWETEMQRLEEHFGPLLCGLSGLILVGE